MTADASAVAVDVPDSPNLIDAVGCGIWIYDGEHVRFVNEALANITGFTKDELLAPRFFESLMHPDHRDMIVERGQARVRGEPVPDDYEVSVIHRDGRRVWLQLHARRIAFEGRACSLVSAVDITPRKQAELALRFLADVSGKIGATLDYEETLSDITRLCVPHLGDYAVMDLREESGELTRIAGAHLDTAREALMMSNSPDSRKFGPGHPIFDVAMSGESKILTGDIVSQVGIDERHRQILTELGPRTYVVVPLRGSGGTIHGTIAVASERPLPQWQLELVRDTAEEVGRRAAHAIERARLYATAQTSAAQAEYNLLVLDAMFAASPLAMVFIDRDMRIENINRVAARKSIPIAEHIGRHPAEVMPEHWKIVGHQYERVLATGEPSLEVEHSQTHPRTGVQTTWVSSYYPVFRPDRELMGVAGVGTEISARKASEERLRASEERLRLAQAAARMGTWEWDMRTNVVTWSEEMEDTFGVPRGSFAGTFEAFIASVHPDDRGTMLASAQRLLDEGFNDVEHRVVLPDGSIRWLAGRGQVFVDENGERIRAIGVGIDITERKLVEEELRRANLAKDELLGLVSHELRTPLTHILGNAQALRRHDDTVTRDDRLTALDDIAAGAERLQRVIENMLVLSHIEAQSEVETEPVLLQRFVPHLVAQYARRDPTRRIEIRLPADLPPVFAQPTYLEQIVHNLLSNAEKYSSSGDVIEVRAEATDEGAQLGVLDQGRGIPDGEIEMIFTPFFRSSSTARTTSGAGLGLAVCRRLAEVQGGRMWAEAREGRGSAFWLVLPFATAPESEQGAG